MKNIYYLIFLLLLLGIPNILSARGNAFTPNGDGLNDTFKPVVNTELVRQFNMSIYNKWGERIFETSDATKGWDGENAMAGVYVWVISYANRLGKSEMMKGSVAVIK